VKQASKWLWLLPAVLIAIVGLGGFAWGFLSSSLSNSEAAQVSVALGIVLTTVGIVFVILRTSKGGMTDSAQASKRTPLHEGLRADGDTIDTRYRYQRLLYVSMRPAQTAAVALAAAAPVAVGGLLVWTLFEPSARQAVGLYLIVAGLGGAAVWLVTSPLYLGWWAERRGKRLRALVLENLSTARMSGQRQVDGDGKPEGEGGPSKAEGGQSKEKSRGQLRRALDRIVRTAGLSARLSDLEPALAASYGFSVFALWPDTEVYLTSEESRRLSVIVMRARALRSVAVTATLAAAASLGVGVGRRGHAITLFELALAFILVAVGSLTRSNWARGETLQRKAQLVAGHAADLLAAYGIRAKTPADRLAALGRLSVSILDRKSGLPWSSQPGSLGGDSLSQVTAVVGESFEDSLRKVLRRRAATNVTGALRLSPHRVSAMVSNLDVEVTTGDQAWRQATGTDRIRFQVTGGEEHETASFEVAVDAPGLDVSPARHEGQLATSGGVQNWTFSLQGERSKDVSIWVTLYSSGRYVQAVELQGDSLVHDSGR
jgi:hypothetical protein